MKRSIAHIAALLLSCCPVLAQGTSGQPTVQGPSSATSGHIATYNGTTGKIIQDGGAVPTSAPCSAFGTSAGTCVQGNDSRIVGAYQTPTSTATWVPIDSSGGALTFTVLTARYMAIGPMTYITGTLSFPSTADTHAATIGGLPTASLNQAGVAGTFFLYTGAAGGAVGFVGANATTFTINNPTTGAGITNATLSGTTIRFQFMYPTN